jgi:hypothetical protein
MYFGTKSYLKNNHYHTAKQPLKELENLTLVHMNIETPDFLFFFFKIFPF